MHTRHTRLAGRVDVSWTGAIIRVSWKRWALDERQEFDRKWDK